MRTILLVVAMTACDDKPITMPAPVAQTEPIRQFEPTPYVNAAWWCEGANPDGACDSLLATCDGQRRAVFDQGRITAPCQPYDALACVSYRGKLDGKEWSECFGSITKCTNARDTYLSGHRQDVDVIDNCVKK